MGNGDISIKRLIGAALLVLVGGAVSAGPCSEDVVHLRGPGGEALFRVEVADTDAARAQGLMHRESLPTSAGMLFVYPSPRPVGFWMKNTLIPLDMIFMDASGTVRRIGHEAQPHDERPVMGGDGIQTVLEINGGLARRIGISEGWEMRHPAVDQDAAAWPCAAD
ncbi:DUF192 domain-containing protein [Roseovarius autotrophicus]|uniref:DUF192 domain-containing protein n=1 Tax=Roseovarius autotrophicus TaxID=2824121 RepID=UPI0019DD7733|nr:DUF192 domain-containing protein [Roseovarius autotrophicus]MBE0454101.1 DUF192 domain-containing protein [Roseovarius sp.]